MNCYFCGTELEMKDRVGRGMTCPSCKNDLHVCRNCEFFDANAYNECREPQAERVLDKEKANFCDYFVFSQRNDGPQKTDPVLEAKKKLEALFKK